MPYLYSASLVIRLILIAMLLAGCATPIAEPTPTRLPPTVTPTSMPPTPTAVPAAPRSSVVIDTDMAFDDVMAVLYLLQRPDVNVEAITVSGTGLSYCEAGTRRALGLVALAGSDDIPVACGREEPLEGSNALPTDWRSAAERYPGLNLPETGTVSDQTAVELLTSTIESSPRKVVLLTLGPLTNVAEALQQTPALVSNLETIYVMGGAVDVPGNTLASTVAEWNMWIDPHAANQVFGSGAPVTLVPLDATNMVPVTIFLYEALKENHSTKAATAIFDLLTGSPSSYRGGSYFWDPLAAAILTDESLATFEMRRLSIMQGGWFQGQTMESKSGAEVRVAVSADSEAFEQEFLSTLNDGREVSVSPIAPDVTVRFDDSECTSEGLETLEKRTIIVSLENRGREEFGLSILTLHEGKTREDLDAWKGPLQPPWTDLVVFATAPPRGNPTWVVDLGQGTNFVACIAPGTARVWPQSPIEVAE